MIGQTSMFAVTTPRTPTPKEAKEARAAEFYRTPARAVEQLLNTANALGDDRINGLPGGQWVEPGSGDGAIWSHVRKLRDDVTFQVVELRPEALRESERLHGYDRVRAFHARDWLELDDPVILHGIRKTAVVVMNSPFSLTHQFVQAAFDHCPDAWVCSLQRRDWRKINMSQRSKSKERGAWLLAHFPEYILDCVGPRFSFTGDRKTDMYDYQWTIWSPTGRDRTHARHLGPCNE